MDSSNKLEALVFDITHVKLTLPRHDKYAVSLVALFIKGKWNQYPYGTIPAHEILKSEPSVQSKRVLNQQDYTEFLLLKDTGYEACVDYFNAKYGETNAANTTL